MNTSVEKILHEVKKVIAGKDDVLEKIMMTVLSRGHVLLDDVPGTGKTTTALAFSRALGLQYGRIQFTPDVLPSDIVGFSLYRRDTGTFTYQPGAVMTNLLLADEINRTSSKTQSALLEVMEERQVTVDGITHPLPDPFVVIATQNPVGSAGTQLLPLKSGQVDKNWPANNELNIDGLTFKIYHTPGHTQGSVVLNCGNLLFSGDTLFAGSCGRTDMPGGSMRQMQESLSLLANLPLGDDTQVLPGHESFSTLGQERRTNPYMDGGWAY